MGFMKTGTDIKNMIHIGELSMMYLGLVCLVGLPQWTWSLVNVCLKIGQVPWVARLLSMNPYRPKTVDAFDHVIYFSLARLMERISGASQPASSSAGKPEKSSVAPRNDYIAGFLEAQKAYPDVVTNDNIVMYILTNVSKQSSSNPPQQEPELMNHPLPLDLCWCGSYCNRPEGHHLPPAPQPLCARQAQGRAGRGRPVPPAQT